MELWSIGVKKSQDLSVSIAPLVQDIYPERKIIGDICPQPSGQEILIADN